LGASGNVEEPQLRVAVEQFFNRITSEVRAKPIAFRTAGSALDSDYSAKSLRARRAAYKSRPPAARTADDQRPFFYPPDRLAELTDWCADSSAQQALRLVAALDDVQDLPTALEPENARRVFVLVWLLHDEDAGACNPAVTAFQNIPWVELPKPPSRRSPKRERTVEAATARWNRASCRLLLQYWTRDEHLLTMARRAASKLGVAEPRNLDVPQVDAGSIHVHRNTQVPSGPQPTGEAQPERRPPLAQNDVRVARVLVDLPEGLGFSRGQIVYKSGVPAGSLSACLKRLRVWGVQNLKGGAGYYVDTNANRDRLRTALKDFRSERSEELGTHDR